MLQEKAQALGGDRENSLSLCGAFGPETGTESLSQDPPQFQPKTEALTKQVELQWLNKILWALEQGQVHLMTLGEGKRVQKRLCECTSGVAEKWAG